MFDLIAKKAKNKPSKITKKLKYKQRDYKLQQLVFIETHALNPLYIYTIHASMYFTLLIPLNKGT